MSSTPATCPDCRQPTHRLHGHSPRPLADFPWAPAPIELRVIVRRFRCGTGTCRRQTCAEHLPRVAPRYARTTTRLATTQAHTGLALGGAAGARHLSRHGVPGSRNTLLRRVRRVSLPQGPAPEIMGVDDGAWRTGQRSGTLIVDLHRGCPMDGLEERAAETVATWLHAHPGVTMIARDRAAASAAGRRQGAPAATQVAARLHLLTHVAAALQEVFSAQHRELDQLNPLPHHEPPPQDDDAVMVPPAPPAPLTKAQQQIAHNRARRVAASAQAPALCQQGWTSKAIAAHLGRHHRTVKHYLGASTLPARPPRPRPLSSLAPYKADLLERWQAGYRSVKELFHEMQGRGFPGHYSVVAASISRWRPPEGRMTRRRQGGAAATPREGAKPLPPSRATWLVMRREAKRDDDATTQLARLQAQEGASAEAITWTPDFAGLVRQRQPAQLEAG